MFFVLVVGSLSSTADRPVPAVRPSGLMMTDVYGKRTWRAAARLEDHTAGRAGHHDRRHHARHHLASLRLDILVVLVFVGALWGAIVFLVIASFYWDRVTNRAFSWAVAMAVSLFCRIRFELIPLTGVIGNLFETIALVGAGVVTGLMALGFFGRRVDFVVGGATILGVSTIVVGGLRGYVPLISALATYGASAIACTALSLRSNERFYLELLDERVRNFQKTAFDKGEGRDSGLTRRPALGGPLMNITLLSLYILLWPALAMGVLVLLFVALIRDIRAAKKKSKDLVRQPRRLTTP